MTVICYLVPTLLDMYILSVSKWCHFQISHYNSAQDDFGTELAVSTRTGLEPGKLLCGCIHMMINLFGGSALLLQYELIYFISFFYLTSCLVATTWNKLLRVAKNSCSHIKSDLLILCMWAWLEYIWSDTLQKTKSSISEEIEWHYIRSL